MGNLTLAREDAKAAWSFRWDVIREVRYALRSIRNNPLFSATIVITLALGLGVNTTIFTLVNAVLIKPLPFQNGERLLTARYDDPSKGQQNRISMSYVEFLEFKAQDKTFESLETVENGQASLGDSGQPPERVNIGRVTPGLFGILHTQPILGRGFNQADALASADTTVLLGHDVWKNRYGRAKDIVGRPVQVDRKPAIIIGVMPPGFRFPQEQDMWLTLKETPELKASKNRNMILVGFRKPEFTQAQVTASLALISRRLEAAHPVENKGLTAVAETFHQRQNGGPIRIVFLSMLGAVGFVLLIACANVANMMLSRALARKREMSIRAAIGASRWQMIRQLLIETTILSFMGGIIGLGLAHLGVGAIDAAIQNVGKPYWIQFEIDYFVFGYLAAICLVSGILFGLAPALQSSRVDLNEALKDGSRTAGTQRGGWLSASLVVFQFTLALVLLTGAGLFIRSIVDYQTINTGVPVDHILTAGLGLPDDRYKDKEARIRFYDELLRQMGAEPGVVKAALATNTPGGGGRTRRVELEGESPRKPEQQRSGLQVTVTPGYFQVVNLPILAGRGFDDRDGLTGRETAIVTKTFASSFWPNQPVIGKRFRLHNGDKPGPWLTVAGVSGDMLQQLDESVPLPVLFTPYPLDGYAGMQIMIRTAGEASSAAGPLRTVVNKLDSDLPVARVLSQRDFDYQQRWYLRVFGSLFSIFAVVALVMASVGIYSVVAQSTGRRTQEIGVRMALGATSSNILTMILARGVKQLAVGVVLGLAAAFAATRVLTTILTRVSPTDPVVFGTVSALLIGTGLLACWLPARRAAGLQPVKALRYE